MARQKPDLHETFERNEDAELPSERKFGFTIASVFFLIFLLPAAVSGKWHWWALTISAIFILATLIHPQLLVWPNRLWHQFGLLIHRVVNPVLLGLMFTAIVVVGTLRRLFNRDPMRLKFEPSSRSYWIPREPHGPNVDDFPHQF